MYFDHQVEQSNAIFWEDQTALKKVQMLIRPQI